jgi:hypothetical protein
MIGVAVIIICIEHKIPSIAVPCWTGEMWDLVPGATGRIDNWSCTFEQRAAVDVSGEVQDLGCSTTGGRVSGSCACTLTMLGMVEHKGRSAHSILLCCLSANAAAACWARVLFFVRVPPGARTAKLAPSIAGKPEFNIRNGSGEPGSRQQSGSPLLVLFWGGGFNVG